MQTVVSTANAYTALAEYPIKTYDFLYRNASASTGGKMKLKNNNSITADIHYDSHAYYYAYTHETWDKEYDDNGKEISFPYSPGDKGLQSDQSRLLIQTKGIFNLPISTV